jgi:ubiquinone/menaquinone biosynthesis C-methylase UbiE
MAGVRRMRERIFEFRCPKCKGKVKRVGDAHICNTCSTGWPVHNGIPCFNTRPFYWSQVSRAKMKKLIAIARAEGWKDALEKVLLPATDKYTFDYAVDESRADWHFMLPVKKGSGVLDIGCGWGSTTISLARYYNVVGADSTLETLEFLRMRAAQEGTHKLQLVRIDPLDYGTLPFPDSSFDLVVMNGVLEWVGALRTDIPPDECQKTALKEILRVLKPNGGIYIGIENRFAYTAFLGAREHGNIPFADLMPRRLANRLSKLSGRKTGYRTYIYGYGGYKKILKETGFHDAKFYLPLPSYRDPIFIFSEDDANAMEFFIKNKIIRSTLRRAIFALPFYLHVVKLFTYSYGIFVRARK